MAKAKVILAVGSRKKKINQPEEHRQRLRERMAQPEFKQNTRPGENNGNPEGHNQFTHGHKQITQAVKVYLNDKLPPKLMHLATNLGLPETCTFADVIGLKQLVLAAEGSLGSTQFVQDNAEDKLKGPNGGGNAPKLAIEFVSPDDDEDKKD
jgi:hypothetical protein